MVNNLFFQPNSTLRLIRNGKKEFKKTKRKEKRLQGNKEAKVWLNNYYKMFIEKEKKNITR